MGILHINENGRDNDEIPSSNPAEEQQRDDELGRHSVITWFNL
jgi:hypothetical protein